jgi:hypothetical protein
MRLSSDLEHLIFEHLDFHSLLSLTYVNTHYNQSIRNQGKYITKLVWKHLRQLDVFNADELCTRLQQWQGVISANYLLQILEPSFKEKEMLIVVPQQYDEEITEYIKSNHFQLLFNARPSGPLHDPRSTTNYRNFFRRESRLVDDVARRMMSIQYQVSYRVMVECCVDMSAKDYVATKHEGVNRHYFDGKSTKLFEVISLREMHSMMVKTEQAQRVKLKNKRV